MASIHLSWALLLLAAAGDAEAQRTGWKREKRTYLRAQKELSPYCVSVKHGITQFWGELNERNVRSFGGIAFQAVYWNTSDLSLELGGNAGRLGGRKREFYDSRFVNDYATVEITQRWNFMPVLTGNRAGPLQLNAYAGVGLSFFSASAYSLTTGELVRFTNHAENSGRNPPFVRWGTPRGKIGVRKTHERVIPVGIALDYQWDRNWKAGIDLRLCFARTDKLDATSGRRLINPEEADSYSDTPNDFYTTLGVSLTYRFLRKPRDRDKDGVPDSIDKCPDIPGTARHRGCPDSDRDGVPDHLDDCPEVPGKLKGCPE